MYTCEICKYSWNNEEEREYIKYYPFRCPKCRQDRERSKREDSIPEWGAEAPLNYDAWQAKCKEKEMRCSEHLRN